MTRHAPAHGVPPSYPEELARYRVQRAGIFTATALGLLGSLSVSSFGWSWWPRPGQPVSAFDPLTARLLGCGIWLMVPLATGYLTARVTVGSHAERARQGRLAAALAALCTTCSPWMLGLAAATTSGWMRQAQHMTAPHTLVAMTEATLGSIFGSTALLCVSSVALGAGLGHLGASGDVQDARDGHPQLIHPAAWMLGATVALVSGLFFLGVMTLTLLPVAATSLTTATDRPLSSMALFSVGLGALVAYIGSWTLGALAVLRDMLRIRHHHRPPSDRSWSAALTARSEGWWLASIMLTVVTWPVVAAGLSVALTTIPMVAAFSEATPLKPTDLPNIDELGIRQTLASPLLWSVLMVVPNYLLVRLALHLLPGQHERAP